MRTKIDIKLDINKLLFELNKTADDKIREEIIAEIEKCNDELDKIVK